VPEEPLTCRRCQQPVLRFAEDYETFERMHWSCFHYAFEHELEGNRLTLTSPAGIPVAPPEPSTRTLFLIGTPRADNDRSSADPEVRRRHAAE